MQWFCYREPLILCSSYTSLSMLDAESRYLLQWTVVICKWMQQTMAIHRWDEHNGLKVLAYVRM